jgi:hypothetical protein
MPKLLMIQIVLHAVELLNFFPTKGGILDTKCPKTIMSGETLDYKSICIYSLNSTVRCTRKIPHATAYIPEPRAPFLLDPAVIFKEDSNSWL